MGRLDCFVRKRSRNDDSLGNAMTFEGVMTI